MRLFEFNDTLFEGYREAERDFSAEADLDLVKSTIAAYRELVSRNQFQGVERNIDYWRSQGWQKFQTEVSNKSRTQSKTQLKRSKLSGNYITLEDSDEWLIVVPLDKDASCFHGKSTDWCTSKRDQAYFEDYFYSKNITLIYFINSQSGNKWAVASHNSADEIEIFDQDDADITQEEFRNATGLDAYEYVEIVESEYKDQVDRSRDQYRQAKEMVEKLSPFEGVAPSPELDSAVIIYNQVRHIYYYCRNSRGKWPQIEKVIASNSKYAKLYFDLFAPGKFPPELLAEVIHMGSIDDVIDRQTPWSRSLGLAVFKKMPPKLGAGGESYYAQVKKLMKASGLTVDDFEEYITEHAPSRILFLYNLFDPSWAQILIQNYIKAKDFYNGVNYIKPDFPKLLDLQRWVVQQGQGDVIKNPLPELKNDEPDVQTAINILKRPGVSLSELGGIVHTDNEEIQEFLLQPNNSQLYMLLGWFTRPNEEIVEEVVSQYLDGSNIASAVIEQWIRQGSRIDSKYVDLYHEAKSRRWPGAISSVKRLGNQSKLDQLNDRDKSVLKSIVDNQLMKSQFSKTVIYTDALAMLRKIDNN